MPAFRASFVILPNRGFSPWTKVNLRANNRTKGDPLAAANLLELSFLGRPPHRGEPGPVPTVF